MTETAASMTAVAEDYDVCDDDDSDSDIVYYVNDDNEDDSDSYKL